MKYFKGNSFSEVYRDSLYSLLHTPDCETKPRGMAIKEDLGVVLEIENPLSSLYLNNRRSSQFKYIAAEFIWYFLGNNKIDFISKYASFWKHIQNEDGTANSAYGNLIFNTRNTHGYTQYQWALESLKKDRDSRQAILHFNNETHQYDSNKDFVCTIYGIFHIRNNKLDFTVKMRSNDAILGLPTDVAFFTMLQQQAHLHLLQYYPDLELGKYSHHIDSYHIYEKHFPLVSEMLSHNFVETRFCKLTASLVDEEGSPNKALVDILDESGDLAYEEYSDPIYKWIRNNIIKLESSLI